MRWIIEYRDKRKVQRERIAEDAAERDKIIAKLRNEGAKHFKTRPEPEEMRAPRYWTKERLLCDRCHKAERVKDKAFCNSCIPVVLAERKGQLAERLMYGPPVARQTTKRGARVLNRQTA